MALNEIFVHFHKCSALGLLSRAHSNMKIIVPKLGIKFGYKFHYLPKQKAKNQLWFLSYNKQISV